MSYRIFENADGSMIVVNGSGTPVRTTNEGRVFLTKNRAMADEALAYLNQDRPDPMARMKGSHRMKSIFGAE